MTLRVATQEDLDDVVRLCNEFYKHSNYRSLSFSKEKVTEVIQGFIEDPYCLVLLLQAENEPVGVLCASAVEPVFSRDLVATEICWFVQEGHRGNSMQMLDAYEYWAKEIIGIKHISMSLLVDERLEKIYSRKGYTKYESTYIKEL